MIEKVIGVKILKYFGGCFLGLILMVMVIFIGITGFFATDDGEEMVEEQTTSSGSSSGGNVQVTQSVTQYRPIVEAELEKHGMAEHTNLVLGIIMQESGGTASLDIMQASESLGLPMNTIQDPVYSIEVGVEHFVQVIRQGEEAGVDFEASLQAYNFGTGYIDYVAERGGEHTDQLAREFSAIHAQRQGWSSYGDVNYIPNVMRYVQSEESGEAVELGGDLAEFQAMWEEFEGMPYNFGGQDPSTSFDCSGLWFYLFRQIGVNIPRTAQEQYDFATPVEADEVQPGDFVFFHSTYDTPNYITHIGIYVGDGMMFHAGDPLQYDSIETPYWQQHFAGYGRIVDFSS